MTKSNQSKHHKDEQDAGEVDAKHQLPQRKQRAHPVPADGKGHRSESPKRSQFHDESNDLECDMRDRICKTGKSSILIKTGEGQARQNGQQQHLKNLTFGKRINEAIGDDVEKVINASQLLAHTGILANGLGVQGVRIDVHAAAGLEQRRDTEADTERQRRDDFKVEECLDAYSTQLPTVADVGDADNDTQEDDGRNHHPNEFDEPIAKGLHGLPKRRKEEAHQHACHDAYEDTRIQRFMKRLLDSRMRKLR